MSTTLYRKYRPQHFSDVIGQTSVVRTLENALTLGRVGQAYLLTGPRGTGKTTLARLFAKAINCSARKGSEPCDTCEHCRLMQEGRSLDVIEIDAASHTGVDNIRDLRDTIKLLPTIGSHKIYIIDEVHMLSTGAWNAFLKTLEEPPLHVVFLLATTEIHKVPETILSRCQRFDLSRFPVKNIEEKLTRIAKAEKIKISPTALRMIAELAEGGMRDAESVLTQVASLTDGPIDEETISSLFGSSQTESLITLATHLANKDMFAALRMIRTLSEEGANLSVFVSAFLDFLRRLLLMSAAPKETRELLEDLSEMEQQTLTQLGSQFTPRDIVRILELFQKAKNDCKNSSLPELPLEIAIVKSIDPTEPLSPSPRPAPSQTLPQNSSRPPEAPLYASSMTPPQKPSSRPTKSDVSSSQEIPSIPKVETLRPSIPPQFSLETITTAWTSILEQTKILNASLALALVQAKPVDVQGNILFLCTRHNFHKERLENPQSRLTLTQAFGKILSFEPEFKVILEHSNSSSPTQAKATDPSLVSQAIEMLGGKLSQES